ncbi:uncharacterized protein LOC126204580 [Schistocerca nitens]|uniref:uncharacterized protein LOC126204580 n=1 Tax=Schistocerca nitens TaxID=7011 RepID=UPI002117559D|nr:uncharacterized protein LOC126204580 [Schistocerca nitens]
MAMPRRVDRAKVHVRSRLAKKPARFAVGDTEVEQHGADRFRRRYLSRVGGGAAREGGGLSEAQKPLQQLREQERLKRQRLKARQRDRSNILANTLALAFPDMVRAETQVEEAVLEEVQSERQIEELKMLFIEDYQDCEEDALNIITEHGFEYEFDWLKFLAEGELRHRILRGQFGVDTTDNMMFSEMNVLVGRRTAPPEAMETIEEKLSSKEQKEPEESEEPDLPEADQ